MRHRVWLLVLITLLSSELSTVAVAQSPAKEPVTLQFTLNGHGPYSFSLAGQGPYSFSCSVVGAQVSGVTGPTGSVQVVDTTTNQTVTTTELGAAQKGISFHSPAINSAPDNLPISTMASGDFNNDGKLDLAISIGSELDFPTPADVLIQIGDGLGNFSTPFPPNIVSVQADPPRSLAPGIFNGNKNLDIAMTDGEGLLLGDGSGAFTLDEPLGNVGGLTDGTFIATADFNKDGHLDVAQVAGPNLKVQLGNGDGTFQPATAYAIGEGPEVGYNIVIADFNNDGKLDIAVSQFGGGNIFILLGNGDGTFQSQVSYPAQGNLIVEGDFNQDGNADLIALGNGSMTLLLGNGDGTFDPQPDSSFGSAYPPTGVVAADFDKDGKLDLAILSDVVWLLFGKGDGTFQPPVVPSALGGYSYNGTILAGDFNNDGYLDLAISSFSQPGINIAGIDGVLLNYQASTASASGSATITPGTATSHNVICSYPGDSNFAAAQSVPIVLQFHQAYNPMFDLPTGKYSSPLQVTISEISPGATIYYTTDGTTPTTNSTVYSGPIQLSTTTTLKAMASGALLAQSPITEAVYTIVSKPALTVIVKSSYRTYGSTNPTFAYQVDGLKNGDTVTVTPQTTATPASPAGNYPITATVTGAATANYSVNVVNGVLAVEKANLNVWPSPATRGIIYGQPISPMTGFSVTGLLNGDTQASAITGSPALSTTATSTSPVGEYPLNLGLGSLVSTNYRLVLKSGAFYIYKAKLTGTIQNVTITEGQPIPAFTYTIAGYVNGDTATIAFSGAPVLSTTATSTSAPGHYKITAAIGTLTSHNYGFAVVPGTLTIEP